MSVPYWDEHLRADGAPDAAAPPELLHGAMHALPRGAAGPVQEHWSPEKQRWFYQDQHGAVQGPFPATTMQDWYQQRYFYAELPVCREGDVALRPLGLVLQEIGNFAAPFLVPPFAYAVRRTPSTPPAQPAAPAEQREPAPGRAPPADAAAPAPAAATAPSSITPDDIAAAVRVMKHMQGSGQVSEEDLGRAFQQMLIQQGAPVNEPRQGPAEQAPPGEPAAQEPVKPAEPGKELEAAPQAAAGEAGAQGETPPPKLSKQAKRKQNARRRQAEAEAAEAAQAEPPAEAHPEATPGAPHPAAKEPAVEHAMGAPAHAADHKAPPAPWASLSRSTHESSLREIQEAEERAQRAQQQAAAMAQEHAREAHAHGAVPAPQPSAGRHAPPGMAWNRPVAAPKKSLAQIQQEESERAARARAEQSRGGGLYASTASQGGTARPDVRTAPWARPPVRPGVAPAPAPAPAPMPAPAPAPASPAPAEEAGWVTKQSKHVPRRDALSQMNDLIPRPKPASPPAPARLVVMSVHKPVSPPPASSAAGASPQFVAHIREQLRGFRANGTCHRRHVPRLTAVNDFIDMLLSFPPDPSPDVLDLVADTVYANSSTIDGRRFAEDFFARRKLDAQDKPAAPASGAQEAAPGSRRDRGFQTVQGKAGRRRANTGT